MWPVRRAIRVRTARHYGCSSKGRGLRSFAQGAIKAEVERRAKDIVRRLRWKGPVLRISGATGAGTDELKQAVMRYLEEHPRVSASQAGAGADTDSDTAISG